MRMDYNIMKNQQRSVAVLEWEYARQWMQWSQQQQQEEEEEEENGQLVVEQQAWCVACLPRLVIPLFAQLELEAAAAVKEMMEVIQKHLEAELGLELVGSKRVTHHYSPASFQPIASAGSVEFAAAVALS